MNNLVKQKLRNWIFNQRKWRFFTERFSKLFNHLNNTPLDEVVATIAQEKLGRMIKNLDFLRKSKISFNVKQIGWMWLQVCWEKIITNTGYTSIQEIFDELQLVRPNVDNNEKISKCQTFLTNGDFLLNYEKLITPIYVKVINKKSEKEKIKLCLVRPSLPRIQGVMYGICVEYYKLNECILFYGLVDRDSMRIWRSMIKTDDISTDLFKKYSITKEEAEPYLNCFSLRDYLIYETRQITNRIKQNKEKIDFYKTADLTILLSEYHFLPDYMKVELINLLLEFNLLSQVSFILSKGVFPFEFLDTVNRNRIKIQKIKMDNKEKLDISEEEPYEVRIDKMNTNDKTKNKAWEKLKIINKNPQNSAKAQKYLDGILKLPFGVIKNEENLNDPGKSLMKQFNKDFPSISDKKEILDCGNNYIKIFQLAKEYPECKEFAEDALKRMIKTRITQKEYLEEVADILESNVHGHPLVKTKIRRLLAQWISGGQSGIILGLEGPPGNGKTTLIKHGLSKCIKDKDGKTRPVGFIPLGGSANASSLVGHGYTYLGSTWGRIADILMDSECMNPILLFDELDKISNTESGREIIGILTHLTDSTQNDEFYDKYFEGVALDLSKALMVFTFNDRSKIDPILLDRMTVIKTQSLSLSDKKIVTRKHLIPQITKLMDIHPDEILISDSQIEKIIDDYTREAGARQLKRILENLIQELNLKRLMDSSSSLEITQELVNNVLYNQDKIRHVLICKEPRKIGQIYGMWANALGLGGVLPIQVRRVLDETSGLLLTGTQGDTMKESMKCAKSMAWELLYIHKKPAYIGFLKKKQAKRTSGLQIHCPSTSTPKDGPSAGGAICIAIFSYLSRIPIRTDVAMTGEIDLDGNITAIGGLEAKLNGAKKAGIKIAIIPKENEEQLLRLRNQEKIVEDDDFKVVMVDTVYEAVIFFKE